MEVGRRNPASFHSLLDVPRRPQACAGVSPGLLQAPLDARNNAPGTRHRKLSGESELCFIGSCCFVRFRRQTLHLQPMAEPTPVETGAPPKGVFGKNARIHMATDQLALFQAELALDFALHVPLLDILPFVKELFPASNAKLALHPAVLKIELQGNERQPLF